MDNPKYVLRIASWMIVGILLYQLMYSASYGLVHFESFMGIEIHTWGASVMDMNHPKPFAFRVLVPLLMRPLVSLGIDPLHALAGIQYVFGLLAFYALIRLMSLWFAGNRVYTYSLAGFIVIYAVGLYNRSYTDYPTLFFFCLSYVLIARRKLAWYYVLFPIATLNRETTFLLIWVYAMLIGYRIAPLAYQAGTWMTIRLVLSYIFRDAPGGYAFFEFNVIKYYLAYPYVLILIPLLILILIKAYYCWGYLPKTLRVLFSLFPLQVLLHLVVGYPFEFRVLIESMPAVVAVMVFPILPKFIPTRAMVGYFPPASYREKPEAE